MIYLEDESGRVTLVGDRLRKEVDRVGGGLVTGTRVWGKSLINLKVLGLTNCGLSLALARTGVVTACLGMENASGDFEVIDLCFAGLAPLATTSTRAGPVVLPLQTGGKGNVNVAAGKVKGKGKQVEVDVDVDMDMKLDDDDDVKLPNSTAAAANESSSSDGRWVALVSGLSAGSSEVPEDLKGQLLVEWLMGELGDVEVSPSVST